MRYLTGRPLALAHTFMDEETPLSPSAVTVTLTDATGVEAFTGAATEGVDDSWGVSVPAQPAGLYSVVWNGVDAAVDTDYVEVVGGWLFTLPEARASDSELQSTTEYPAAELIHYREVIETEFQTITGRSFVPRTEVVDFVTDGSDTAWLGIHDCNALTALSGPDGALVASDYPLDANGILSGLSALPEGTSVRAVVDYGFRQVPSDVKRVALIRLRFLLAAESSGVPDRATSFIADTGGTFTLATPGRNGYRTGIPDVDAVLSLYSFDVLDDILGGV